MKVGRKLVAAAGVATVAACAPATAGAAVTATVTGDDGVPALLTAGASLPLRNMDVKAVVRVPKADAASYSFTIVDAAGVGAASPQNCTTLVDFDNSALVNYRGNGEYTLTVSRFTDNACRTAKGTDVFKWNVQASVSLGQPAGPLLIRQPFSFSTITQNLDFAGNPGATTYEIKYGKGLALNPDGSFASPVQDAFLDRTTGKVQIMGAREPGDYTVVARAKSGDFFSPWSAPVTMKLMSPFDLASTRFPDSRGPRYQLRGEVREHAIAGGRVTVAIAKGKKGKRFRTLGKPKVNSEGVFTLRFTIRRRGAYRLRYSYRGGSAVQRGTVYESITIRRVIG
jgi:hypothetical protein